MFIMTLEGKNYFQNLGKRNKKITESPNKKKWCFFIQTDVTCKVLENSRLHLSLAK